ncbi:MAG: hypothetical protein ACJAVO_000191 [Parvibaculaceae bacterium]|jgi:hypothetical protein
MDDLLTSLYREYLVIKEEFEQFRADFEKRLHPYMEMLGGIIMALPLLWFAMWIFGS